jgi:hypothetical protein
MSCITTIHTMVVAEAQPRFQHRGTNEPKGAKQLKINYFYTDCH